MSFKVGDKVTMDNLSSSEVGTIVKIMFNKPYPLYSVSWLISGKTYSYREEHLKPLPTTEFKVGDIVRISKSSPYYNYGMFKPTLTGKIYCVMGDGELWVNWGGNRTSSHKKSDLELVNPAWEKAGLDQAYFETGVREIEATICLHRNKYKNIISAQLQFWVCPDCGADLGDV